MKKQLIGQEIVALRFLVTQYAALASTAHLRTVLSSFALLSCLSYFLNRGINVGFDFFC
jgi:hypothetical protein